jgi:hypothetical protein
MQQLAWHSDDGIAPGEAVECFNPNAAVVPRLFHEERVTSARSPLAALVIPPPASLATLL